MIKKEMIAMLLAGGQGSRLGVLTSKVAKPAVAFGGKYRIIDFPLSNCINSGIDTVGVLTQYQPLRLNTHIGIGIPWDLDRNVGGVSVLPPYEKSQNSEWYTGTANAIYQNLEYMEQYHPEYVLILSGDHIYKMDYKIMLDYQRLTMRILQLLRCLYLWKKQADLAWLLQITIIRLQSSKKSLNIQRAILHQWVYTYSAGRFLRMHSSSLRISRNAISESM